MRRHGYKINPEPSTEGVIKMAVKVSVHEANTNFSKLLSRVEKGEEIIICKSGHPVARLNPINEKPIKRTPGQIIIAEDFDAPQ